MTWQSTANARSNWLMTGIRYLQSIEFGGSKDIRNRKIPAAKTAELLHLLLMLMNNGLSLPKALAALGEDRAARRWLPVIAKMHASVRQGGSLSAAMAQFPRTFSSIQIEQVRIGERTGALAKALENISNAIEQRVAMRRKIIKKLSYPMLVMFAGFGLVIFMVTFVVPQFENVFTESQVSLPTTTVVVTAVSRFLLGYGHWILLAIATAVVAVLMIRSRPKGRMFLHRSMLRIPILGGWLRDAAALQFAEGVMSMVQSGYTPVEAVEAAVPCVRNRAIRYAVLEVCRGVQRGERLSTQMSSYPNLFSPTLCQLVNVGEKSGDFGKAMQGASQHLRNQLERRIDAAVSMIEPVLTLSLAAIIGAVVMSIYLPMFHMFEVLE